MKAVKVGQLAGIDERFCPVAAVAKWPYRHLFGEESDKVSKGYFANGRFRSRGWTMWVESLSSRPLSSPMLRSSLCVVRSVVPKTTVGTCLEKTT